MKKITLEQCKKVAEKDSNIGISAAVEELQKLGFNCSYYWDVMNKVEDVDEDNLNIKTRNKLYKKLHISKLMKKAYEKIEEFKQWIKKSIFY